jgi:uncharacterized protein DUF6717
VIVAVAPKRTFGYAPHQGHGCPDMNVINVIVPYKYLGMWVFDDPKVGLVQEPFVGGADVIIDRAIEGVRNAENGFVMLFSATPFPGHQVQLTWQRADGNGNYYYSHVHGIEGWLCPALLKYFDKAPEELYFQVKPKPQDK